MKKARALYLLGIRMALYVPALSDSSSFDCSRILLHMRVHPRIGEAADAVSDVFNVKKFGKNIQCVVLKSRCSYSSECLDLAGGGLFSRRFPLGSSSAVLARHSDVPTSSVRGRAEIVLVARL